MWHAISRRRFCLAGLSCLGSSLFCKAPAADSKASADACILIFLNGGMSHLDTFDPKPDQPAEIRGEFKVIATRAPGLRFTEPWPLLAQEAHRLAVVRSVGFEGRLANHSPACYHMLTGVMPEGEAAVLAPPRPTDHPAPGAVAARLRPTPTSLPAFAMVPDVLIENAHLTPGQFAGWLGSRYEAFCLKSDPSAADYSVPALARPAEVPQERLAARRTLLEEFDSIRGDLAATRAGRDMAPYYERAFDLLTSTRAQAAFDLTTEPAKVRDRYGRNKFGQSVLLARRLVEAGVRFVNVHWPNVGGGGNWDTHGDGFRRLKQTLIPPTDSAVSALLAELAERGRLERTLVVVLTEFGRAPQIGKTFQNSGGTAGRDHWSTCFSVLLAGGGVRGGQAHGDSDVKGAFPFAKPVTPADITATIYHALGIDPALVLADAEQRTHQLCKGKPILDLFR